MKWGSIIPLIGGFTIAAKQETGNDPDVILSYPAFKSNDSHCLNHFKMDSIDASTTVYDKHLDFVVALPPCSALSALNCKSCADYESVNWLYDTSDYVLKNIKPTVLVGENAPGLFQNKGKQVVEKLKAIAATYGYSFSMFLTDTFLHGIPQHRKRTFYFFTKGNESPVHNSYRVDTPNLIEYLSQVSPDLLYYNTFQRSEPLINNPYYKFMINEYGSDYRTIIKEHTHSIIQYLRITKQFDKFVYKVKLDGTYTDKFLTSIERIKSKFDINKGIWDSSPHVFLDSINAIQGRIFDASVHPTEERYINVQEHMHLMGLPSNFILCNNKVGQVCQNVPVCTARDMIKETIKIINRDIEFTTSENSFKNNLI